MADAAPAKKGFSLFKPVAGGLAGLAAGIVGMYSTAIVNSVAKPARPVANFSVNAEGLSVQCQNHATGDSGWWDFGDGTPLEPFDATQPAQAHAYAKPGSYTVKLTVRNFLSEENERTVPVDLQKGAVSSAGTDPSIANFSVEAIGGATVAPATFRVRGEVKNAERVIWDLGGEKLEVTDSPGAFEKLIVFEKAGSFPIQLTGLTDHTAVKQAKLVNVSQPRSGSLSVLMRIADSGQRVLRKDFPKTVALPLPVKGTKQMTFEKLVNARPGFTVADAKLGKSATGAVKNVKVEVAADRKSAKVTGEFTAFGDSGAKASGGSDAMIPLILTQERTSAENLMGNSVAVPLAPDVGDPTAMSALVSLPPAPFGVANVQRKIEFEIREVAPDDRISVIGSVADMKLPLRNSVRRIDGREYIIEAKQQASGQLRISLTPARRI